MPKWTKEQLDAIEKEGTNIIVSAGAGSGKTAVLTERVIHKLKNGVHLKELLILTFTRAAAEEMKDRIRKKIKENSSLLEELDAINSAYITTFDSFALSVVKKYHYIINISNDISITDDTILEIEKKKILDSVFQESYDNPSPLFSKFIKRYAVKNDNQIREYISALIDRLEGTFNRDEILENLETKFYSDQFVSTIINSFETFIDDKKKEVTLELENMSYYFNENYMSKIYGLILPIINTKDLEEFSKYSKVTLPNAPKGSDEEAKEAKARLKAALDGLLEYTKYSDIETIKKDICSTKDTTSAIVALLKRYFDLIDKYKQDNNLYTFNDIAFLAIKLVKNNDSVRTELKDLFKEIMIDEYQDTNDIQEEFIKLIANDNVYTVGDVKQSIYRFRGANPKLFQYKYDKYSKGQDGIKIDLVKNFRSRKEVLDGINKIFGLLMDDELGGARYKESHEMVYGNTSYDVERMQSYDYDFEVLEYSLDQSKEYSNIEIEIFAIARDIQNKIKTKVQVLDKSTSKLRPIEYCDFAIIIDRSKHFDLFKKVFEYLGIPLEILKDGVLNSSREILLIKNMIDLLIRINTSDYGLEFKYNFLSIGRSFLYEYLDECLFDCIEENKIKDSKIYCDFISIKDYNSASPYELVKELLDVTEFYQKLNKVGDYENINTRVTFIKTLALELGNKGYTIEDFKDYLDEIINKDYEIKYTEFSGANNSVQILTIHKSKGLEYPVCYYADIDHDFNTMELKSKFIINDDYGLISEVETDSDRGNIIKELYREYFLKEEISEKIRLFYVALTRAREKMIIVIPKKDIPKLEKNNNGTIELLRRLKFKRLSDFVYSIKGYLLNNFRTINNDELDLSKEYLYNKNKKGLVSLNLNELNVEEINVDNGIIEDAQYSKLSQKVYTKEEKQKMEFGTLVHEAFEYADFNSFSSDGSFISQKVASFLRQPLLKDVKDARIYHEYEFYYESDNSEYHGIIDLMLEYSDHIDIIDYKLKGISDEGYITQLEGYKKYIKERTNKKVYVYLYSIIDDEIQPLKEKD